MTRKYTPKEIEVVFEQVEASSEEVQTRINHAFDVLFEATLRYLRQMKEKEIKVKNDHLEITGEHNENIFLKSIYSEGR